MPDPAVPLVILADFNAANFAASLNAHDAAPRVQARAAAWETLGQEPAPDTVTPPADEAAAEEVAVVWTRPETTSAAFARLVAGGTAPLSEILDDVDAFACRLRLLTEHYPRLIVMTWAPPRVSAAFGSLAMKTGGLSNIIMRMNLRVAEQVEALPGVVVLDASAWLKATRTPEEAKLWYAAKIPFVNEVFRHATRQVKSTLLAWRGGARKLIVVDLDNTLWGGVVGEVGWQGLRLGGLDPTGEAYVDFQRTLRALSARGFLLAIASKNEEAVALEAISRHPEMLLRQPHFAGWRINWSDKAANLAALSDELNLGLDSVVFIDDSPAERARVREALPEVLVPEWPSSPLLYSDALIGLGCFDAIALSDEDRVRAALYAQERARSADRSHVDLDDWLRRLELKVDVEEGNDCNLPRVVQLLNKTNQMNLTTRRVDAVELTDWLKAGRRKLWTFRVRDRFGDAGLSGVVSVDLDEGQATLVDFVLSCRVFGRRIEDAMLHTAIQWARDCGARPFVAKFVPTAKNAPCLRFFEGSGLRQDVPNRFAWDTAAEYPPPPDLQLGREKQLEH